jgi:hypothetical protein
MRVLKPRRIGQSSGVEGKTASGKGKAAHSVRHAAAIVLVLGEAFLY